jgi:cyclopropane fatty-acyl-phospholipid synthase-like methyltransferase
MKTGYRLLEISACYDFFQTIVGATAYVQKILGETFLNPEISSVIDLGCGTGAKTPFLNSKMKYLGVDISEDYIARAKRRESDADRTYVVSDLSLSGWLNVTEFYNPPLVLAMGIFHHLSNQQMESLLRQLQENVPPGSQITSLDPTITRSTSKAAAFLAKQDRGKFLRTPEELEGMLDRFGFSTEIREHKNQLRIPYDTLLINGTKR